MKVPHLALQGVSKVFVLIESTYQLIIQKQFFDFSDSHSNENKLRTHTLQARCGTFTLHRNVKSDFFARIFLISFIFSTAKKSLHRHFAHR